MRVVIVGAGIGGLALAHGLKSAGIDVLVLERDEDLRHTLGHGLRLDRPAMYAIDRMLPAPYLRVLCDVSQGTWVETGYSLRDHQGRMLARDRRVDDDAGVVTDRVTLRLLLGSGLGDRLRLGASVAELDRSDETTPVVVLGTGERIEADVLVAADGAGSFISHELAGAPIATPSPLLGFAGWTPSGRLDREAAQIYAAQPTIAVGPEGYSLYSGEHRPLDQALVRRFAPEPLHTEPVHVWGAVVLEWAQTAPLADLDGVALREALAAQLRERDWSPVLVELIERCDPATLSAFRFSSAPSYAAGIAPWQTSAITAIGDAAHPMPPTGGRGASTAIRDAHALSGELAAAHAGQTSLRAAISSYEHTMRSYAARMVSAAQSPPVWPKGLSPARRVTAPRASSLAAAAVAWARRDTEPAGAWSEWDYLGAERATG